MAGHIRLRPVRSYTTLWDVTPFSRAPVPKTCPHHQGLTTGLATKTPYAALLEDQPLSSTAESLCFTEVLRRTRSGCDFQRLSCSDRLVLAEPLLPREVLRTSRNRPFCRYLSPLPDSNRGPPPYHGGFPLRDRGGPNSVCLQVFPATQIVRRLRAPLSRRTLSGPQQPRTCPQNLSPGSRRGRLPRCPRHDKIRAAPTLQGTTKE